MSYDAAIVIETGKGLATVEEIGNMTYNVGPMFNKALGAYLGDFNNKTASDLIPIFEAGLKDITDASKIEEYEAMNPSNGWGSHAGAISYLANILEALKRHPAATLEIS